MKKMRVLTLILVVLLLATLFVGCSKASSPNDYGNSMAPVGKPETGGNLSGSTVLNPDVADDRKLIRTVTLNAETEDMDSLLTLVTDRITQLGGYVESREIYSGSNYSNYRRRHATLKLRIPADKLDAFVGDVSGASNIVSSSETAEDVTLQYVATESHLKVLRTEEERLLQFLAEAKGVSEMLEIEKRLTEVRAELEIVTNQLNTYANLVSYGTVHLQIDEVKEYTVVDKEEPTLWQRIADGFVTSVKNMGIFLEGLLVFMVAALPYLTIPAVIAVIIILAVRRSTKKKKDTPPPKTE